jgi:hypothetical protein
MLMILVFAVLASGHSYAQDTTVKNPRGVAFVCPDHGVDTEHEVDIISVATGQPVQTLLGGDPIETAGEVVLNINVQPIAFGQYRFGVRAVAGSLKSDTTLSAVWERVPGPPTNVRIVR